MNNKTLSFMVYSLGCKVNSYEARSVERLFLDNGLIIDNNNPDVVVINTCAVTHVSEQKSRQHIRSFKNRWPNAIVIVMGCYSQNHADFIVNELKAQIVVGTTNKFLVYDLLKQYLIDQKPIIKVNDDINHFTYEEICKTAYIENIRAYLKIQDGCANYCSYCLIPYLRGKPRSRNLEDIINEAKYLINLGIKEIVVSGIHVGSYGYEFKDINFTYMIEELLKLDGLKRLTISSIEASEISDELINVYSKYDNLAKHIHIPLQSGSEKILKLMNRKYDKKQFLDVTNKLKEKVKDIAITTDVIVGFPNETEEDFLETYNFIKEVGFMQLHVFPYSKRENTVAAKFKNQVDEKIKKQRAALLRQLSDELYNSFCNSLKGKTLNVLVESYNKKSQKYYGHSENYVSIQLESDNDIINQIIPIIYQ